MKNFVIKTFVQQTLGTISTIALCSFAFFTTTSQHVAADIALGSPDIIEISVQHLFEVKEQFRQGLGISWSDEETSIANVKIGDEVHSVELTRVYSVSSYPYVELIKATPQIGPWAPFYEPEYGERPRTSIAWKLNESDYYNAKDQMDNSGAKKTAQSSDFVYYECLNGVQLEIVRHNIAPNPDIGIPNTPPFGKMDFGPLYYLSIPQPPAPVSPGVNIPVDDFILRKQISEATRLQWDISFVYSTPLPYVIGDDLNNTVLLGNPTGVNTCNGKPFINTSVVDPNILPFAGTKTSTTFSHAWLVPGSGADPAGAQVMSDYESQLLNAGFERVIRLDGQALGVTPYPVSFLSYFKGVDNIDIQLVNEITPVIVTSSCTDQCGACNN